MATEPTGLPLPPGFEQMTREQQIQYVHRLWDHVQQEHRDPPEELAPWQQEHVAQRLDTVRGREDESQPWREVMQRLRARAAERGGG